MRNGGSMRKLNVKQAILMLSPASIVDMSFMCKEGQ
jgi:hypothetical protein